MRKVNEQIGVGVGSRREVTAIARRLLECLGESRHIDHGLGMRCNVEGPHPLAMEDEPMAAPRWLARVNRRVTNRLTVHLAARLPGFGVVVHLGRKTQRIFRTPVNVFRCSGGYVIALTYGPGAQWVRNILAMGGCSLETKERTWRLTRPHLFHDEHCRSVPVPVRLILGLLRVADFLQLTIHDGDAA